MSVSNEAFIDSVFTKLTTISIDSACSLSESLNSYIASLTIAVSGVDYVSLHSHVFAETASAFTVLLIGCALLFAPVIFGKGWLTVAQVIIAFLFGFIASGYVLQKDGGDVFHAMTGLFGMSDGPAKCSLNIVMNLIIAISFAYLLQRIKPVAFFAIGAAGSFFLAYVASGLVVPLLSEALQMPVEQQYATIGAAVIGLGGGLIFATCAEALLDTAIGLLSAVLIAQSVITIVAVDFLNGALAAVLRLDEFYVYYIVGLAIPLAVYRCCAVASREAENEASSPSKTATPMSRGGNSRGGTPLSRNTPGSRQSRGTTPGSRSML